MFLKTRQSTNHSWLLYSSDSYDSDKYEEQSREMCWTNPPRYLYLDLRSWTQSQRGLNWFQSGAGTPPPEVKTSFWIFIDCIFQVQQIKPLTTDQRQSHRECFWASHITVTAARIVAAVGALVDLGAGDDGFVGMIAIEAVSVVGLETDRVVAVWVWSLFVLS